MSKQPTSERGEKIRARLRHENILPCKDKAHRVISVVAPIAGIQVIMLRVVPAFSKIGTTFDHVFESKE